MAKKTFANPIANELKGSLWFKRLNSDEEPLVPGEDEQSAHHDSSRPEPESERTNERTVERPNGEEKENQRHTKRHSFEIYRDQWQRFQKLRAQALLRGEQFNMSAIVRDAIDEVLEKLEREE